MENNNHGILIFLGPPFSGKETQTIPLSQRLGIPVFSMGHLIRKGRQTDPAIENAFQEYTVKGLHVPINIKFGLLQKEMDQNPDGFILDNFPGSSEDLIVLNTYLATTNLRVKKVFYLKIGHDEMVKRFTDMPDRGRADDTTHALETRSLVQSEDREPVLDYYKQQGVLVEIDGELPIDQVKTEVEKNL